MVHLTTVLGSFHGHVLAARLTFSAALMWTSADAVDAAFDERYEGLGPEDPRVLDLPPTELRDTGRSRRAHTILVLVMVGLVLVVGVIASFH